MSIPQLLSQYGGKYGLALMTTWKLTFLSFGIAFLLGVLITVLRVSPISPLRMFGDAG